MDTELAFRLPLLPFGGILGYQVTGWFFGETLFGSVNLDAMTCVFLLLAVGVTGWLAGLIDSTERYETRVAFLSWLIPLSIGVVLGSALRFQM
jgi:hypothetical protein